MLIQLQYAQCPVFYNFKLNTEPVSYQQRWINLSNNHKSTQMFSLSGTRNIKIEI